MDHHHNDDAPGWFGHSHHICMWETQSFSPSAVEVNHEALKLLNHDHLQEIERLRSLLVKNKIDWTKPAPPPPPSAATSTSMRKKTRQSTLIPWNRKLVSASEVSDKALPHLPNEIILRILSHVVSHKHPIIDPFWKLRPENLTKKESARASLNLNFLATCRAFKVEGTRLLIEKNTFVFTQAESLQNFSNLSLVCRSLIQDVTLRIVGKYYDTHAVKRTLYGDSDYHETHEAATVWVSARPSGSGKDRGIQGYCWQQVMDFLRALVIQSIQGKRSQLLPGLKTMRIDLVNFCEHIPFVGSTLISVLRWHLGHILDELSITGLLEQELSNCEERYFEFMVKDEGVIRLSPPTFVSIVHSKDRQYLKTLQIAEEYLRMKIVRPKLKSTLAKRKKETHPEGGEAPESIHPLGITTWKWTSETFSLSKKKWVEFHLGCGMRVKECEELRDDYEPSSDEDGDWEDAEDDTEAVMSDTD